jgi:formylglycine-generating enzyme required for sulfatase activity
VNTRDPHHCDEEGECAFYGELFENCCLPMPEENVGNCTSPNGAKRMYGNALEWVLDKRDPLGDHSWCAEGCTDPPPRSGSGYIAKGGSVRSEAFTTRISYRGTGTDTAGNGAPWIGVRCVLSPITFDDAPDGGE